MTRWLVLSGAVAWLGLALLLAELRWFRRRPLVARLRPYAPGAPAPDLRSGVLSMASFREVIGPLAQSLGTRVAHLFGVSEELAVRLERVHAPLSVAAFRTRQLGWSLATFGLVSLATLTLRPPPALALLLVVGAPLLTFLIIEQSLARASAAHQRRLFLELPVVSEQLGMLLSAGYSLGGALNRLAARGHGACADDLTRVCGRVRQGLSEIDALREWAELARVDALDRMVGVLALNREAGDLGRLIADEALAVRRDVHRELIEVIEKRGQQVWIPVTVATLVPGVLLLAVPFIEAMRLFTTG